MSCLVTEMRSNQEKSIGELVNILKGRMTEISGELVTENWRHFDDCEVVLLVFEKLYWRNRSYANLTVLLTETEEDQTADIVGSGGREGLFNISWGCKFQFIEKFARLKKIIKRLKEKD